MSEQQDPGAVVTLQNRIARATNQLTSARILIDKAQAELLIIRVELDGLEEKERQA